MRMRVAILLPLFNSLPEGRYARVHDFIHAAAQVHNNEIDFDVISLKRVEPWCKGNRFSSDSPVKLWAYLFKNRKRYAAFHIVSFNCYQYWFPKGVVGGRTLLLGPNVLGYFPGRGGDEWNLRGYSSFRGIKERVKFGFKKRVLSDDSFWGSRYRRIFYFGKYHRQMLLSAGADPLRLVAFPGGVRGDVFCAVGDKYRISNDLQLLYVGELNVYKGFDTLLRSLRDLRGKGIKSKTVIIGPGEVDHDQIRSFDLQDAVDIRGFVPRGELGPYYRGSDFYIHPSQEEAHPTTMLEALACGTPVIAPRHLAFLENCKATQGISNTSFFGKERSLTATILEALQSIDRRKKASIDLSPLYHMEREVPDFLRKYKTIILERNGTGQ